MSLTNTFTIRLYCRHAADQLCVCTLPIHSLLHIADDIEAMGPVWCYWAFLMERYCGALGRANLNPRFPFLSMDWHVLEVAQLAQIKYTYDLFDILDLGDCRHAMAKGMRYPEYPHCIFVRPHRVITVNAALTKQLAYYIGNLYDVNAKDVERHIKGHVFITWGKMQQTSDSAGLDMITGHTLMPDTETPCRDATFVKVIFYFIILEQRLQLTSHPCSMFPSGIIQSMGGHNTMQRAPLLLDE
jgi:hypothetical protein